MAPEQAAGDYKNIGVFADIYGLSGLLYFCLTGQPPFVSENVLADQFSKDQDEQLT